MINESIHSGFYPPDNDISENNRLFLELLGVGSEEHCRYLWERRKINGTEESTNTWLSVGNPRNKVGKLKTQSDITQMLSQEKPTNETVDYFLSPNEFFSWRCKKGLSKLHANYIDIDTTNHEIKSKHEQQNIIDEVLEIISLTGIPKPNALIKSGSGGLHLYWIYEPVEAYKYRLDSWKKFTYSVIEKLGESKNWKVDATASTDASRVLRLPGSKHNTSKRTVEAHIVKQDLYKIEDLYKDLYIDVKRPNHLKLVPNKKPKISESEKRVVSPEKLKMYQVRGRHNIRSWWKKIYENTRMFCKNNGVNEGSRDYAAFILFVSKYNEIEDEQKAFDIIVNDNQSFIHLPLEELTKYLSTARTTQYKYKKETIAQYLSENLNMQTDFLYDFSKKASLTPLEVRKKQKESALSTAEKKRLNTLSSIRTAIVKITTEKLLLTAKLISKYSGIQVRTIYRYWSEINDDYSVIRSASI